ncbi:hypothetical protein BG10_6738 [Bacillus thuringiensis serovar morrisoni]|nr:hypothetical protein BG10_6738 [Bacillus thuringiensis serovar morrisoni]
MCVKKGEASVTSLVSAFGRAYHRGNGPLTQN